MYNSYDSQITVNTEKFSDELEIDGDDRDEQFIEYLSNDPFGRLAKQKGTFKSERFAPTYA